MKTYKTKELASLFNIHPNTLRKYEDIGFIPKPERKPNGYRTYTDLHYKHLNLIRTALDVEIIQSGLRKQTILIITTAKDLNYRESLQFAKNYLENVQYEQKKAEEALEIAEQMFFKQKSTVKEIEISRKQAAEYLNITIDSLRSWELNGLVTVKRHKNGYRIYTEEDLNILKIIRILRDANYSLSAILRMLNVLSTDNDLTLKTVLDTPEESEFIISVCDRLISSLKKAEKNAQEIINIISDLIENPPL